MKARIPVLTAAFVAFATLQTHAQTLNWGVPVGEQLKDSNGDAIDDTYVFELGAFALNFNPEESNVGEWLTHWRVFDSLVYDQDNFKFTTSDVFILNDVKSGSTRPNVSSQSFAGLDAYIWVRKGDNPVPGSEWFVGRAVDWKFPLQGGDCCPGQTIEWSVSDLGPGETPEWGRQNNVPGPGSSTFTGTLNGVQTHTFIPEPSSSLLLVVGVIGLVLVRRRSAVED